MPVNTPNNQPLLVAYGQSQPLINVGQLPIISNRNPGVNDRKAIGSVWVNKLLNTAWIETSVTNNQANWLQVEASGGAGVFSSLTVVGTTNLVGTTGINLAGAAGTQIGVGGTGAVSIGNATGNTTIAAGNLTVTNGNLSLGTLGNKINITTAASGTNASVGKTASMAAGTIVVATAAVTASSIILVSHATAAGTMGNLSIGTIVPGVSFAILTDNVLDTSTVNFMIIN
jgi:hypothetical protein